MRGSLHLEARPLAALPDAARDLLAHGDPRLRAAALRAACAHNGVDPLALAGPHLAGTDEPTRQAAAVALLRHGGIQGVLAAGERLLALERSSAASDRIALAHVIGGVAARGFYQPLIRLLGDEEATVRASAIQAAGAVGNPRLLPLLVAHLESPATRSVAASALVAHGHDLVQFLGDALAGRVPLPPAQLAAVVRAAAHVDSPGAGATLEGALRNELPVVREAAVGALVASGFRAAPDGRPAVQALLRSQLERALRVARAAVETTATQSPALARALRDEAETVRAQTLATLSLLGQRDEIARAQYALRWGGASERALALESLDVALPSDVTRWLLPLADPSLEPDRRMRALEAHADVAALAPAQRLAQILSDAARWPSPWTRACAAHAAGQLRDVALADALAAAAVDPDECVREHARWALAQGDTIRVSEEDTRMLTIEKVAVLKSTDVFGETPDHALAPLARVAREVVLAAGDVIIHQGAFEDAMFVVVGGELEVDVDGRIVQTVGPGSIVGEMQVIDPAPRSASVRARGETLVFHIGKEVFDEVMADRPEVARAVNRMLVRRLRAELVRSRETVARGESRSRNAPDPGTWLPSSTEAVLAM